MKKDINFLTLNPFLHRGYFNNKDIPENSNLSFKKALKTENGIEFDIRLTADKKIVVFHDHSLKRMCNVDKNIESLTYEELQKYYLLDTKQQIPLLTDVLKLIDGRTPILIEIKSKYFNLEFNHLLVSILDNYQGKFAIQSFNHKMIDWFKKNRPDYIIGLLIGDFANISIAKRFKYLIIKNKYDFISISIKNKNKFKSKSIMIGWTIKEDQYLKLSKDFDGQIIELN